MTSLPHPTPSPFHFGLPPHDTSRIQVQHKFEDQTHQYCLSINDHTKLAQPIFLRGISNEPIKVELRIEVGRECELDFIEHWEGVKAPQVELKLIIHAKSYSHVRYIALQSEAGIDQWQEERQTHAEESTEIELFVFHFGAKSVLSQMEQNAQGRQAHIETWITSRRQDHQTLKLNYQHRFHDRDGAGRAHLQGVALDEGKLEMKGNIWIGPKGNGTDTHLEEKALNLSSKAQVQALPGLEVNTNDVKAGHSAAVHNLNPEQLIYTQSRGLSESEAKRLMIEGFLKKSLKEIKDLPSVYNKVQQLI